MAKSALKFALKNKKKSEIERKFGNHFTFDPLLKFTSLVTFERKRGAVKERSNLCFRLVFAHSIKFITAHCDLNLFFQIAKWESLEVEY